MKLPGPAGVESEISRFWQEALELKDAPSGSDSFFDLGGDSLAAVRLITAIEKRYSIEFPLTNFFHNPTISQQASLIWELVGPEARERETRLKKAGEAGARTDGLESPKDGIVVRLCGGIGKPPLFLAPGGFGGENELFLIAALASHLKGDRPVYGFRAPLKRWAKHGEITVKDMAEQYIAGMKALQPTGPYLIGGECVAGVVAFEMAQKLRSEGEEVARLFLLDAKRPSTWDCQVQLASGYQQLEGRHGSELARRVHAYYLALLQYRSMPYEGAVDLIVTEKSVEMLGATLGWEECLAGPHLVHRVSGDHNSYIREGAEETARILDQLLTVREPAF